MRIALLSDQYDSRPSAIVEASSARELRIALATCGVPRRPRKPYAVAVETAEGEWDLVSPSSEGGLDGSKTVAIHPGFVSRSDAERVYRSAKLTCLCLAQFRQALRGAITFATSEIEDR